MLVHPIFRKLWKCSCQPRHKVFFWLLLKDRLNTRGLLRMKNMHLDSYACELCIWQEEETLEHLFLHCGFAKRCWELLGLIFPPDQVPLDVMQHFRAVLAVPFYLEIIILLCWTIWTERN